MDRRMYRGNMGSYGRGRSVPPYRQRNISCDNDYDLGKSCGRPDYDDKDCDKKDFDRFPLGMCYVPWQKFENLYENEFVALANGTLFKDLDLEFLGRSCR